MLANRMKNWLPMPRHSLVLLLLWLMLNGWSVGQTVLGIILAIVIPKLTYRLVRGHPAVKNWSAALLYVGRLLVDIFRANIEVAIRVLRPNEYLKPGWIAIPMVLPHPFQRTLLASTITLTPGTVSVDFSEDETVLYVHVLHIDDAEKVVKDIKDRYERGLRNIFGC